MAVQRIERNKPREQSAEERRRNFAEVSLGFDEATAKCEASRCLSCKNAPCMTGCPVGVRIPEFISAIRDGDFEKAITVLKSTNSLPAVCGRVCPQEKQCESKCIRAKMEGAVSIGALERFTADHAREKGIDGGGAACEKNGKKAAVVGSGPSGLTCAGELAKAGFDVTVFEAFHKAGGVLVYGIPEFRLPKKLVQSEIDGLKKLGVKIETNVVIGKTITIDELMGDYDAIFIGTGAGLPMFLRIPGENLAGVCSANEYLTRVNLMKAYEEGSITPLQRGKNIVVVGAGNVAMDAARTALRMGADKVTIVYRRGEEEIPARREEVNHAREEGVEFKLLTNPVEILGENGWVNGIRCIKMQLGEPDASGRRSPVAVEGSEFEIEADMVIVALGTSPNPLIRKSCPELATTKKGTFVVDEATLQTSVEGIYAGGDAVTGAATVILAMGAGKKAAASIIEKIK